MSDTRPTAETRRAEMQAAAAGLGLDEALISDLVDGFYAKVRNDPELGPIFAQAIGSDDADWVTHLATMKRFWSSVALHTGVYSGQPMVVHGKVRDNIGFDANHFPIWLSLFEQTVHEMCEGEEASKWLIDRARRIADSLRLGLFYDAAQPRK